MGFIYSKEELMSRLSELRNKRDLIQKNRVEILKKYTRKTTQEKKEVARHYLGFYRVGQECEENRHNEAPSVQDGEEGGFAP